MPIMYLNESLYKVENANHTKFEMMAEVAVPEAAWNALDFLPYKGQRTKPLPSTFFFP